MSFAWLKKIFKPKPKEEEPFPKLGQHTVLNSKVVGEEPASNYDSTIDEVAQSLEGDAYVEHVRKMREDNEDTISATEVYDKYAGDDEPVTEHEEVTEETVLSSETTKKYSWNEFRSAHKGMTSSEISGLWAEYKEGTYEVRTDE